MGRSRKLAELSTVYDTSSLGFRNRIINGGMSVWQRGTSFSVTAGQYVQDRWFLYAPSGTFSSARSTDVPSGFQFSAELTGTNASYTQRIEATNSFDLVGQSVTVSFWAKSVSGTQALFVELQRPNAEDNWSGITSIFTTTVSASLSSNWTYYTATFANLPAGVANGLSCVIGRAAGGATTTRITGVQLEAGTVATPFERRPYGTELALCQRYCQIAGSGASGSFDGSTTTIQITEKCVVPMRAAPSGTLISGVPVSFRCNAADLTAPSPALANFVSQATGTSFWTQVTGFTGGTSNAVVTARNNNATNGGNFILLSAEL